MPTDTLARATAPRDLSGYQLKASPVTGHVSPLNPQIHRPSNMRGSLPAGLVGSANSAKQFYSPAVRQTPVALPVGQVASQTTASPQSQAKIAVQKAISALTLNSFPSTNLFSKVSAAQISGGKVTVAPATTTSLGTIQLSGGLTGTATDPQVVGLVTGLACNGVIVSSDYAIEVSAGKPILVNGS